MGGNMFNALDWLYPDGHAVAILFNEPGTPVLVFKTPAAMYKHANGLNVEPGVEVIIVGGFHDAVQAIDFAHSGGTKAVYQALWGEQ
jgi:hypothetical protein